METAKNEGTIQKCEAQKKEQEEKKAADVTSKPASYAISSHDQKFEARIDREQMKEATMLAQMNTELVEGAARKFGMGGGGP